MVHHNKMVQILPQYTVQTSLLISLTVLLTGMAELKQQYKIELCLE